MRNPDSIANVIGNVLRVGVLLSAAIIILGMALLIAASGSTDAGPNLIYYPNQIPHGGFDVTFTGLIKGLEALQPFSVIELGAMVLIATPVARVLISVFLFAAHKDRLYVAITVAVLALLLFSMLVTPFIPLFKA